VSSRITAMSVEGSAPTTRARYVVPPLPKPTRRSLAPLTTWSLVTMSPLRSSTKPEPSDWTRRLVGGRNGLACVRSVWSAVMTTTPGASRR
jgi:hypothetical protein